MKLRRVVIAVLVVLAPAAPTYADPVPMAASLASGQKFVQGFYDWYVPKALSDKTGATWLIALKERSGDFDPKLAAALQEDAAAQAKVSDDIVGLDFDPFLNSQDSPERIVTGAARWKGETLLVDVRSSVSVQQSAKPDVVDELVFANGRWQFVNFDYPGEGDLVSTLATLKAQRQQH